MIEFISSINKIATFSFIVTFAFLVYEIWLMKKEKKTEKKPVIPQFDPTKIQANPQSTAPPAPPVASPKPPATARKFHKLVFPMLILMLLIFGGLTVAGFLVKKPQQETSPTEQQAPEQIQEVKSGGIKIYDSRWSEITDDATDVLLEGDLLYIGVISVRSANIDMARIKINEPVWMPEHTTTKYNPVYNVYYREYVVESTDSTLTIDAELHSSTDGWLSE